MDSQRLGQPLLGTVKLDRFLSLHTKIIGKSILSVNRQSDSFIADHIGMAKKRKSELNLAFLGDRVRFARERFKSPKMSQKRLAALVGIKQPSLSDIESGETKDPAASTVYALAMHLRVRPRWILHREEPMESRSTEDGVGADYDELADYWPHLLPETRREILVQARKEAMGKLAKLAPALRERRQVTVEHPGRAPFNRRSTDKRHHHQH